MITFSLKPGTKFLLDGVAHVLRRRVSESDYQFESQVDGWIRTLAHEELILRYGNGTLVPIKGSEGANQALMPTKTIFELPEITKERVLAKKRFFELMLRDGPMVFTPRLLIPRILPAAMEAGFKKPPSVSTVYRWCRRWNRAGRDDRALIDRCYAKSRAPRLAEKSGQIIEECIDTHYLTEQRVPMTEVHEKICDRVRLENRDRPIGMALPIPSIATVYRMLRRMDAYEIYARRFGRAAADIVYRTASAGITTARILERVEIDHTPLDFFVVDEKTMLPYPRAYLTVAIDHKSRMVLGYHISFTPGSAHSVLQCLRHAIMPKDYLREHYPDVENDWPSFGVMESLICDNGPEFHGKSVEVVCFELGIRLEYCPPRSPKYKGVIERFLQTINKKLHTLPGTSFSKLADRVDYDPLKHAAITYRELHQLLHVWIVDVYSRSAHRGIHARPIDIWNQSAAVHPPRWLADPKRLEIATSEVKTRQLTHKGVELHGLRYNGPAAKRIRDRFGPQLEVMVKFNRDDLGNIFIFDKSTEDYVELPCIHDYGKGLSLYQHMLLLKKARAELKRTVNIEDLARARAKLAAMVEDALRNKRLIRRRQAARFSEARCDELRILSKDAGRAFDPNTPPATRLFEETIHFSASPPSELDVDTIEIPNFEADDWIPPQDPGFENKGASQ